MRRFYLYQRKNSPIFYAEIRNPLTGTMMPAKSTGQTEETEALLVVAAWLKEGIPDKNASRDPKEIYAIDAVISGIRSLSLQPRDVQRIVDALKDAGAIESAIIATDGPENEYLLSFLRRFWDYDKSPYVREKRQYGHSIGKRHCRDTGNRLGHWEEFFKNDRIKDVTRAKLKEFQAFLHEKELAVKTINAVVSAGIVAFNWLEAEKVITENPAKSLKKFSGPSAKRGILSPEEVKRLFSVPWKDTRAMVGNLVACTTGCRAGEILALKIADIGQKVLHVRHSFSRDDGLKSTKNREERTVPLLPAIRVELLKLAAENPHTGNGYIFYSPDPDRPMSQNILRRGLETALLDISLQEKDRNDENAIEACRQRYRDRGIVFHSWRHYFATHIADRLDMRTVQLATGHKTAAMAEHYANHENTEHLKQISEAVQGAFGNIIDFQKGGEGTA